MVVEFLTFTVDPDDRAGWLEVEERVWSRFLERQDGFVDKQMWVEEDDDTHVHAVIRWDSEAQWKSIGSETVQTVDDEMGEWYRAATVRTFHVIRDS